MSDKSTDSKTAPIGKVLHLDEYYPGAGTVGKVPIVIKVYDSNRSNEENANLTLQTIGFATLFTLTATACLVYKFFTPEKRFDEQSYI